MEEVPLIAAILAHHPGWEGFALVIVPIVVIAAALAVVKRRVDAGHVAPGAPGSTPPGEPVGTNATVEPDDIRSR